MEREVVLMVKFKGKFVPIERDEPFEEQKGIGKISMVSHSFALSVRARRCVQDDIFSMLDYRGAIVNPVRQDEGSALTLLVI